MQDDKSLHKKEQDEFDLLLSNKLKDHRIPVDTARWSAIEKQIKPKPKKSIWLYVVSAAIIIGLLMLFIPLRDDINRFYIAAETSTIADDKVENKTEERTLADNSNLTNGTTEKKSPTSVIKRKQNGTQAKTQDKPLYAKESSIGPEEEEISAFDIYDNEVIQEEEQQPVIKEEKEIEKEQKKTKDLSPEDFDRFFFPEEEPLLAKADIDNEWTFGLGVSTSGTSTSQAGGMTHVMHNTTDASSLISNFERENLIKQDWEVDYSLPISVGFMVNKKLNNTFSVETGLVYTYLSSDIKRYASASAPSALTQKGTLQLHYLGIPVNVVANIWQNSNWSVYGSAGVMLDKGISMKQKIHTYQNLEETSVEKNNDDWVHGAQWSINGAIGVAYKLSSSWSIYLEPRVSHYFDNDQPISIRTEKKTLFNLSGGIKFNL